MVSKISSWFALFMVFAGPGILTRAQDVGEPDMERARQIASEIVAAEVAKHGAETDETAVLMRVTDALRGEFGVEHPLTLRFMTRTAFQLWERGAYAQARKLEEEILAVRQSVLGAEHPGTLAAFSNLADTLKAQGDLAGARQHYEKVLEARRRILGEEHPDTLTALAKLAGVLYDQGDLGGARRHEEEVLEARRRILGKEHPDTLTALANLASTLQAQGDFEGARQLKEEVLEASRRILGEEHPDTLMALGNLANTLRAQGDFDGARRHEEEVLEARRRILGEEHPDTQTALANLAGTLYRQGDSRGARRLYEEVLEVTRRILGEDHPDTLTALANLAFTLKADGDFAGAREREEEVLDFRRRILSAGHPDTLRALANLAGTLYAQGDFAGAQQRYEEVLTARRQVLGDEHPDTLTTLANLAATLQAQGDLVGAQQREKEVLKASRRILGDEHPDTLTALSNLATTLTAAGDLAGARRSLKEVLDVRRRILGTEHPDTTMAMYNLAWVLGKEGDAEAEQRLLELVVQIQGRSSGLTKGQEAEAHFGLANIHREAGRDEQAGKFYLAALGALEDQSATIDLSEDTKTLYRLSKQAAYRTAMSHFLDVDDVDEALHTLERYRAQSLLTLMKDAGNIPAETDDEIQDIARRYDAITTELDGHDPTLDSEQHATLLAEQRQLQRRLEVHRGQRFRASGAGARELLAPLRPEAIQRQLDPGTVMLAYSVGNERVDLFVLPKEGSVEAHTPPVTPLELWLQWARFFPLLFPASEGDEPTSLEETRETADPGARARLGRWLYDRLLAPAREHLASADRVLILLDGPLHYLPFNALIRPTADDERGWQYLVEWKPIHVVQSATVYAELQKRRPTHTPENEPLSRTLVALGDPRYPPPRDADSSPDADAKRASRVPMALGSAESRGLFELTRLPNTAREVIEIGRLFREAKAQARIYLGTDATEERAKAEIAKADYVHLAAHGLADPDVPANSFIALTIPEGLPEDRDNGILQGWEIMETLRLDADLVVLSACVTAFGPDRGGEGLMSLSRAFQIAGARTVMASLWPVADDSTAELMIRFYRQLLAGEPKDEALRAAQMELIAEPITFKNAKGKTVTRDFSAPYHWAAFQLIGDWQ